MTDETKETICAAMTILKATMQRENCIFGIEIDKGNLNNSKLCIMDKGCVSGVKIKGFNMSLDELNRGLI